MASGSIGAAVTGPSQSTCYLQNRLFYSRLDAAYAQIMKGHAGQIRDYLWPCWADKGRLAWHCWACSSQLLTPTWGRMVSLLCSKGPWSEKPLHVDTAVVRVLHQRDAW